MKANEAQLDQMLRDANNEPEQPKRVPSAKYESMSKIVDVLRQKNYSWNEIAAWFTSRGMETKPGNLATWWHRKNKKVEKP